MTCIAGLINSGTVWMGGDGQATYGGNRVLSKQPKVFLRHGFLYGVAGTPRVIQLLRYCFNPPEHPDRLDAMEYLCDRWVKEFRKCLEDGGYLHKHDGKESAFFSILIGYKGRLFSLDGNFSLWESDKGIDVAGSGGEFALGSLYTTIPISEMKPQDKLVLAIKASAAFDISVGGMITIESLPVIGVLPPTSSIKTRNVPIVKNRIVRKKTTKKKKANHLLN